LPTGDAKFSHARAACAASAARRDGRAPRNLLNFRDIRRCCAMAWRLRDVADTGACRTNTIQGGPMLHYAVVFLVIAIIAAILGFGGIAAGAAEIAKILFFVFIVIAVVTFVIGLMRRP
jgi:uncharacterized membrane protein YtjA (UPF0391 family)